MDEQELQNKYHALEELALDLRSSWKHSTDNLWRRLDHELWELTHNPWAVLQTASREKLHTLLLDESFSQLIDDLMRDRKKELNGVSWFKQNHENIPLSCVAYFSMEFMLSEALPIYSGGLGNVAGDQLKAASDLGVPVVGVGLLYSQGYFRQFIDQHGEQKEFYPYNDPGQLPIRPMRLTNGEWLRLKIEFPGWALWLRAWEAQVGRTKLYLLDSNDIANFPIHRGITSELYGGDLELRLKQEMVLGIGGWRLLEAIGLEPEICHLNEGHAAFAVLERAASFMKKNEVSFDVALSATRMGNVFTTHTAVPAGFDRFTPEMVTQYLKIYAQNRLNIPIEKLLALGQLENESSFNMAYLAIRGSGSINGVSQLHSSVSQRLFKDLFTYWPEKEIPVGYVTNGVHMPSWDSSEADKLWTEACGKERWLGKTEELDKNIHQVTGSRIWEMRNKSREALVHYARKRLMMQLIMRGASIEEITRSQTILNPHVLTLGFARRFAAYKRPDLLLADEARFISILNHAERPIQLIIAGKAHPADKTGHALIRRWMDFIAHPEVRPHVIFLSDYDMLLTEHLIQGVDVWLNTPRRPWEASGTSGMKVLVNGGLNLSELDGWWAEAYSPEVGWAIGDGKEHDGDLIWDKAEANTLYELLENEIIPEFYKRNEKNIPNGWTDKIRESMARLTPHFSSNRTVREYTEKYYIPHAIAYHKRAENNGMLAQQITEWKELLKSHWDELEFGRSTIESGHDFHHFEIQINPHSLSPDLFKVELYSENLTKQMEYVGNNLYKADTPATLPPSNFTARIVPHFEGVMVPLEIKNIKWQR